MDNLLNKESVKRVEKVLVQFDQFIKIQILEKTARSAEDAAKSLNTEVGSIVKSLLLATNKKPEVNIEWRVYTKNPDKPLIRDLIIEGLSLARTQKEEFASVIETNNGDVSKLFITLKEFIAK